MTQNRVKTMTALWLSRLVRRGHPDVCNVCKQPVLVGQKVIVKGSRARYKLRHAACYESLFLVTEEEAVV